MSRIAVIPLVVLAAGCSMVSADPGVVVVSAKTDVAVDQPEIPVTTTDDTPGPVEYDGSAVAERFDEALASVDIVVGPTRPPRPLTVAVIGDSLTLSAQEEIDSALSQAGVRVVALDGVENRRMIGGAREIASGADAIEELIEAAEPELWVIALGTNDVGAQIGTEVFRSGVTELLGLLPADAPVIWVDLWIRDRDDLVVDANTAIRDELGDRSGVGAVVDWHAQAAVPGVITRDGVHLTQDGQQLFADSIVAAIESAFAD